MSKGDTQGGRDVIHGTSQNRVKGSTHYVAGAHARACTAHGEPLSSVRMHVRRAAGGAARAGARARLHFVAAPRHGQQRGRAL